MTPCMGCLSWAHSHLGPLALDGVLIVSALGTLPGLRGTYLVVVSESVFFRECQATNHSDAHRSDRRRSLSYLCH